MIALFGFRNRQLHDLRLVPIDVNNIEVVFQPRPLIGRDATEVVDQLERLSQERGTVLENHEGDAVLALGAARGVSGTPK